MHGSFRSQELTPEGKEEAGVKSIFSEPAGPLPTAWVVWAWAPPSLSGGQFPEHPDPHPASHSVLSKDPIKTY